jgi:hypothetical protein
MAEKKKVFISYAREDLDTAKKLYADLEQQGFEPWLDEKNLLAGQNWREFIPHEIEKSAYVLLLLSDRAIQKRGFVQAEQNLALEIAKEFPGFDIFVIPVRLNDCEIPFRLKDINFTDLFPNYENGLNKIITALRVERKSDKNLPPASPPPPPQAPPSIYVSYSVIDNDQEWISEFVHHLESEITKRMGTKDGFSVFMDRDATSAKPDIPSEIMQQIENSAILIAAVSPGYLNSERCTREGLTFLRNSQEVILVEREQIDENALPDDFKAIRPYRFWVQDRDGKPPRTLGHPVIHPERDAGYFEIINDMSFDLAEKLKCIPQVEKPAETTDECVQISEKADLPPIFLAEVTDDLADMRDDVERYLTQAGFKVVPENPPDMTEAALLKAMEPCRVFVQLLSQFSGKSRGSDMGKCRLQFECAKSAGKTILQWRSPDLTPDHADDDQKSLLSESTVVAVDFEEFKKQAVKRADVRLLQTPVAPDVMVFVNAEKADKTHAEDVGRLMEKCSIGHVLPIWEGNEKELLQDMEAFILSSQGVVVVYGNVHAAWVRKQILYCRNLTFRRSEPLKALGVYDAPVQNKQNLNFKLPGVHIINCRNCLNEAEFKPFFHALSEGGMS